MICELFWNCLGTVWEVVGEGFFVNYLGIVFELFGNGLGMVWEMLLGNLFGEFVGNCLGTA